MNPSRLDPDVMPQKDYTIMLEQIPAHLRSEHKLYEFFDDLFPGTPIHPQLREGSGVFQARSSRLRWRWTCES